MFNNIIIHLDFLNNILCIKKKNLKKVVKSKYSYVINSLEKKQSILNSLWAIKKLMTSKFKNKFNKY